MQRAPGQLHLGFLVTAVLFCCAAGAMGQNSLAQAEQSFAAGEYRETLRLIGTALAAGQLPMEQRYPLLMLRGEALLRVGERMLAADAFTQAANLHPGVKETALARATAGLLRRSQNNQYRPQTGTSTDPIDIIEPESRTRAFAALFADTQASLRPRMQAALRGTTLPPAVDLLQPVLEMGAMEYLATGSAEQSRQTLTELGDHARNLMNLEIRRVGARINQLVDMNNSISGGDGWGFNARGLQASEQRELRDLSGYVRQIGSEAQQARARARELGFDGAPWEPIIADAFDLADRGEANLPRNLR